MLRRLVAYHRRRWSSVSPVKKALERSSRDAARRQVLAAVAPQRRAPRVVRGREARPLPLLRLLVVADGVHGRLLEQVLHALEELALAAVGRQPRRRRRRRGAAAGEVLRGVLAEFDALAEQREHLLLLQTRDELARRAAPRAQRLGRRPRRRRVRARRLRLVALVAAVAVVGLPVVAGVLEPRARLHGARLVRRVGDLAQRLARVAAQLRLAVRVRRQLRERLVLPLRRPRLVVHRVLRERVFVKDLRRGEARFGWLWAALSPHHRSESCRLSAAS